MTSVRQHSATVAILCLGFGPGCGRTPSEPLSGRDEGDRDLCGSRDEELGCYTELNRFAYEVLHYDRTPAGDIPPPGGAFSDPEAALGLPDFSFSRPNTAVSTGNGGVLELGFGECRLTSGGDSSADLRLHEAGPFLERARVLLRADESTAEILELGSTDGFIAVGDATGTDDIDIDAAISGFDACTLRFDAIRIHDDPTMGGWFSEGTGADIDAVELLELVHPDVD